MLSPAGILYVYGFWAALPLTCVAAYRWGGWPERAVSLFYAVALVATALVLEPYAKPFVSIQVGLLIVDALLVASLVLLALRTQRGWLIWASSFQIIGTLGHLSKLVRPDMSRLAYGLMEGASGWPTLLALMIGIWRHHRSSRRTAAARSSEKC